MGSMARKSALILCGDYMEAYEVTVPFYVLQAFGVRVDCISPNKKSGDRCITAVHDFFGYELYTESVGNKFALTLGFDEAKPESYDLLVIPGGRFTELLSVDSKCVDLVSAFAAANKLIFTSCHSQLMLAAAGLLSGKSCTAFPSLRSTIEQAGGVWWEQPGVNSIFEITDCAKDGNFISTIAWTTHGHCIKVLLESLGAKISKRGDRTSVLFLCGDYVEDYAINVPFRALQGLGCKVDVVTPNKKRGQSCITAVYDDEGGQIPSEKHGHNFFITLNWDEVSVEDYDCVVVPGGRSPELLVVNEKAVGLVKEFSDKGKVIAAIGQGKLLLSASGLLKEKKCASGHGMKVIVRVAGGEVMESDGCIVDGKLVTAASSSNLPEFVSKLSETLGFSVVF